MDEIQEELLAFQDRKIAHKTKGRRHGPITRLVSAGDLGELIKPFSFLDSFDMDANQASLFGYHPHSGIVTVTVTFEGNVGYEDSTGKSGVLSAGSVEWMNAGGGVWHTSTPGFEGEGNLRGFQLWLALPEHLELGLPESIYVDPSQIPQLGPVRVLLGEYQGMRSSLPQIASLNYLHIHLQPGEIWTYETPENHDVLWLAISKGSVSVSGEDLSNEIAVFEAGSAKITLKANNEVNLVLGSAKKHPHPLVTGYYSVHTSEDALAVGEKGIREVGKRLKAEGKI